MNNNFNTSSLGAMLGLVGLSSIPPSVNGSVEMITDESRKESEGIVSLKFNFDVTFTIGSLLGSSQNSDSNTPREGCKKQYKDPEEAKELF